MLQPLAYRMRPRQLEDILGQEHLVGPGKIIQRMVQAKRLTSMILYGPPGIGENFHCQRYCRFDPLCLPNPECGHRW